MVLSAAGHALGSVPRDDVLLLGCAEPRCDAELVWRCVFGQKTLEAICHVCERSGSTVAHCQANKHSQLPSFHTMRTQFEKQR